MKETKKFQAESKELLNLMINSIYSNKEIFLRELISNASDAIDKYRYLSVSSAGKYPVVNHEIYLEINKKERSISISDNGIGMNNDDLDKNLGTIAKSGSKEFLTKFKEAKEKQDFNIIGQFGVGFYSAFMVAKKVTVLTKTVDDKAYLFTSDGVDSYSIEESEKDKVGTTITVYLKNNTKEISYDEYLEDYTIKDLVSKYSDYIRYPIKMNVTSSVPKKDKDGKEIEGKYEDVTKLETLNSMIPLWKKNKNDVKDEDLNNFYKAKFMDYEDPLFTLNVKVDGLVSYDALLFVPQHAPQNLYSDTYERGLQLYSKGIFIKDKCPELIPDYLKFVRGLVDSDDFSLNISREMLQQSPIIRKMCDNIEHKIIDKLKDMKKNDMKKYIKFFETFGDHIKFGIYKAYGTKTELNDTLIFHSLANEKEYVSLADYKAKMIKGQKYIYYASGDSIESIKLLPQIEKYRKQNINVLFLTDRIDEFCISMLREYDKVEFKSISDSETNSVTKEEQKAIDEAKISNKRLLDNLKEGLKDKVDEVVISSKLVDSPVCLSTKDGLSLGMEKTLNEQPGNKEEVKAQKVLEINKDHDLFKAFSAIQDDDEMVKKYASVLYEEAMLLEGHDIKDKTNFVKNLNELMIKALKK